MLSAILQIDDHRIRNGETPYKALLTLIGETYRLRNKEIWNRVTSALEECQNGPQPTSGSMVRQQGLSVDGTRRPTLPNQLATAEADMNNLPRYTSMLKEHCERHGEQVQYQEEQLPLYPHCFKVTVRAQGLSFEGIGSSKKVARHLASKEACIGMHIKAM